jgi:hypothetical protein
MSKPSVKQHLAAIRQLRLARHLSSGRTPRNSMAYQFRGINLTASENLARPFGAHARTPSRLR